MVVRLYFSDGDYVIRNITDDELFKFGFLDNIDFINFLEDILGYSIEGWSFCNYECSPDNLRNIEIIDLREACCSDASDLKLINNKIITKFEYLDINSYEYNVALLGLDHPSNSYMRKILVEPSSYEVPWNFVK